MSASQLTFSSIGALVSTDSARSVWPVWRDSTAGEVSFAPLPKKQAIRLWHDARRFERQTRGFNRQDGAIGRNGLAILHALIFDCLNFVTGRLDPAYATIAKRAGISVRSVARGLVKLKAAGILNWIRRCSGRSGSHGWELAQDTNAYGLRSSGEWIGFRALPAPPPPDPRTLGAPEPVDLLSLASIDLQSGVSLGALVGTLGADPSDALARSLAELGRGILGRES